jgi:hypothetical protein
MGRAAKNTLKRAKSSQKFFIPETCTERSLMSQGHAMRGGKGHAVFQFMRAEEDKQHQEHARGAAQQKQHKEHAREEEEPEEAEVDDASLYEVFQRPARGDLVSFMSENSVCSNMFDVPRDINAPSREGNEQKRRKGEPHRLHSASKATANGLRVGQPRVGAVGFVAKLQKQHKKPRASKALKEIRAQQKSTSLIIPKANFQVRATFPIVPAELHASDPVCLACRDWCGRLRRASRPLEKTRCVGKVTQFLLSKKLQRPTS